MPPRLVADRQPRTTQDGRLLRPPLQQAGRRRDRQFALDDGKGTLDGAIGVVRDQFRTVPQQVIADQALDVVAPDTFIKTDQQPLPFGFRNGDLFSDFFTPTSSRGGVAFLGILEGLGTSHYYTPYTGQNVDLPAAWLGERPGRALPRGLGVRSGHCSAHQPGRCANHAVLQRRR